MTGPLTLLACLTIAGAFIAFGFLVGRHYERMFPPGDLIRVPDSWWGRHPSHHHRPQRAPRSHVRRIVEPKEGA